MNKIITMCNSEYFPYGKMFLRTRNRIAANVVCYGPDLTASQRRILKQNNILYKEMHQELFDERMQFNKFWCVNEEIGDWDNSLITFCDWDTFFVQDWASEIHQNISLGITYRENFIVRNYLRAFANGGVIFFRNTRNSQRMCEIAMRTMLDGENGDLPEYNTIWKTLESKNRPTHKRHQRTTLRWWVDQVFLSALIMRCRYGMTKEMPMSEIGLTFADKLVKFYDCKQFNHVDSKPTMAIDKNVYIRHLKNQSGADVRLKDGK